MVDSGKNRVEARILAYTGVWIVFPARHTMPRLSRDQLMSTPQYQTIRAEWRKDVIPYKQLRTLLLGQYVTLLFENETTVRYQLQEMMRVDPTLARDGMDYELDIYNYLIESPGCLGATLMIQFPSAEIRETKLNQMVGVERSVWIEIDGYGRCTAQPNEAIPAERETGTYAVHFLRFALSTAQQGGLLQGRAVSVGVDHTAYPVRIEEISPELQASLMADLRGS